MAMEVRCSGQGCLIDIKLRGDDAGHGRTASSSITTIAGSSVVARSIHWGITTTPPTSTPLVDSSSSSSNSIFLGRRDASPCFFKQVYYLINLLRCICFRVWLCLLCGFSAAHIERKIDLILFPLLQFSTSDWSFFLCNFPQENWLVLVCNFL